jgi:hypothetical protein
MNQREISAEARRLNRLGANRLRYLIKRGLIDWVWPESNSQLEFDRAYNANTAVIERCDDKLLSRYREKLQAILYAHHPAYAEAKTPLQGMLALHNALTQAPVADLRSVRI